MDLKLSSSPVRSNQAVSAAPRIDRYIIESKTLIRPRGHPNKYASKGPEIESSCAECVCLCKPRVSSLKRSVLFILFFGEHGTRGASAGKC